jgi:hypothetical protein
MSPRPPRLAWPCRSLYFLQTDTSVPDVVALLIEGLISFECWLTFALISWIFSRVSINSLPKGITVVEGYHCCRRVSLLSRGIIIVEGYHYRHSIPFHPLLVVNHRHIHRAISVEGTSGSAYNHMVLFSLTTGKPFPLLCLE